MVRYSLISLGVGGMTSFSYLLNQSVIMKKCSTCKEFKPITQFQRDNRAPDGKMYCCRECNNKYSKQYKKKRKYQEIVAFNFYD